MDPVSLSGTLSALTAAGPLAVVLGFAVTSLWRKLEALQRCSDPEAKPCGVCMLCDRRIGRAEHANALGRLIAAHSEECKAVGDSIALLAAKVERQEVIHAEAISEERSKRDNLQAELMNLLNSMSDSQHGGA